MNYYRINYWKRNKKGELKSYSSFWVCQIFAFGWFLYQLHHYHFLPQILKSYVNYLHRRFSSYIFPYIFSWTMVIIISVDRILMVTRSRTYQKFVTMNILYFAIAFLLLKDTLCVIFRSLYLDALEFSNKLLQFTFLFIESFFIIWTIISYLYLLHFVKLKSKKIRPYRHTLNQNENRLTVKVMVIFICLVVFTIPQFIGIIFTFYFDVKSPTVKRNIVYWKEIILYTNSAVNAVILLIDFHRPNGIVCCNVVSYS